jgi:hypothetical protein
MNLLRMIISRFRDRQPQTPEPLAATVPASIQQGPFPLAAAVPTITPVPTGRGSDLKTNTARTPLCDEIYEGRLFRQ